MRQTERTLQDQLHITPRELERRLQLFSITQEDIKHMLEVKDQIAHRASELVDEFYAALEDDPDMARIIGDFDTLAKLKAHLRTYIITLFSGQYDLEYVQGRLRIGLVHKRIGVPPKLYVAAFHRLQGRLREEMTIANAGNCMGCSSAVDSVEKILLFDLTLVFDTYIYSLMEEIRWKNEELETYAAGLEETVRERTVELNELARHDGLTGLLNQRSFYEELRREVSLAMRHNRELSLIYFDLDGFKRVNDVKGHKEGDRILQLSAESMEIAKRDTDLLARYGGDEFCMILPACDAEGAHQVAQRLTSTFTMKYGGDDVTMSVGMAAMGGGLVIDTDSFVKLADEAMYKAKKIKGHAIVMAEKPKKPAKEEDRE